MVENDSLDWAMGELLAYATLLSEEFGIRISGEDVERGTFSPSCSCKTEDTEEEYVPLKSVTSKDNQFQIYNSLLSEYAVLGFDYGYAMVFQILLQSGKLSLVTLPTEHRLLLTSIL